MLAFKRGMLTDGWFRWPGRSGMMLSDGYFWARRDGGYNVYVSELGVSGLDLGRPVAACGAGSDQLTLAGMFSADSEYWLAVTAVSRYGRESSDYTWIRVRTDGSVTGSAVPAEVENLRQGLGSHGELTLLWEYDVPAGWPAPSRFDVFWKYSAYAIDYGNPAAQIAYRAGRRSFLWDGPGFTNDAPLRLAVRAVTAGGVHDGSLRQIIGRADPDYPGTIEGHVVEQV